MKAAGMKALELSGGYKSIRSIARFRTASPAGKDTVRAFAISSKVAAVCCFSCLRNLKFLMQHSMLAASHAPSLDGQGKEFTVQLLSKSEAIPSASTAMAYANINDMKACKGVSGGWRGSADVWVGWWVGVSSVSHIIVHV